LMTLFKALTRTQKAGVILNPQILERYCSKSDSIRNFVSLFS
jgi:hypothetical protein